MYHKWIDDAEKLNLAISMYNLIEHSSNYSERTGSLWFYFKDEATNFNADIANSNDFKFFEYEAKLLENTVTDGETAVLLKCLSNFWRSSEVP